MPRKGPMTPSDLSQADPSESNAQLRSRLGGSTGYVPRVKTAFGFDVPPVWTFKDVGRELRIVPETRIPRRQLVVFLSFSALGFAFATWALLDPRVRPGGGAMVTGAILFALLVGWYSTFYARAVHAQTPPLAIVDLDRRSVRMAGWATELRAEEVVRLELVRVSYTFRRPNWSGVEDGSTKIEYHLVACVRESPERIVWRVIDDLGSFGLKDAADRVARAMQVACREVRVTRFTEPA